MNNDFNVFADIDNKTELIKMYNDRRRKACMNVVYNIEFLERTLSKMKENMLKCKEINSGEYAFDIEGDVKYILDKGMELNELKAEISKCEAVIGALQ